MSNERQCVSAVVCGGLAPAQVTGVRREAIVVINGYSYHDIINSSIFYLL